ncbi:MAG: PspC domain-containing protein [Treponema sp.]|nr:PspC domain-containing protein [Treponema sp.]
MSKKLYKSHKNRMVAGVCGGLAEFFNIDATIIRLIMALLIVLKGAGLLLYLIAAIIIPREPDVEDEDDIDNLKSANVNEGESKEGMHTDEEFDSYFNKK